MTRWTVNGHGPPVLLVAESRGRDTNDALPDAVEVGAVAFGTGYASEDLLVARLPRGAAIHLPQRLVRGANQDALGTVIPSDADLREPAVGVLLLLVRVRRIEEPRDRALVGVGGARDERLEEVIERLLPFRLLVRDSVVSRGFPCRSVPRPKRLILPVEPRILSARILGTVNVR
jgi:hypothetical protein